MLEVISQGLGVFVIAFLGGIAGAVAKHFLTFVGKRAEKTMSSLDALAQLASETLAEIRLLSILYWEQDESNQLKPTASRIVALCDTLPDLYVQLFENDLTTTRQLDVQMNRLSNTITGGSFQQADRQADLAVIAEMEPLLLALDIAIRLNRAKLRYPWY